MHCIFLALGKGFKNKSRERTFVCDVVRVKLLICLTCVHTKKKLYLTATAAATEADLVLSIRVL